MKASCGLIRLTARLVLLATMLTVASSGCDAETSQVTLTPSSSNILRAASTTAPPGILVQPSVSADPPPSSTAPTQSLGTVAAQTTLSPAADVISEMIGKVDRNTTVADLQKLTGEAPVCDENGCHTIPNRLTGSSELAWAKDYVKGVLSGLGYSVDVFDWSRSGYADQDIIAKKLGTSRPAEEIYFVAHLDGKRTVWRSSFPAADDDASGVVDLLQMARVLKDYSLDRTLVLFFSTGEEHGTLGVKSYIDQLTPQEIGKIKYVINLDMLGYDANHDGAMELWHGGHAESLALAELMSDTIRDYQLKLVPELAVGCG